MITIILLFNSVTSNNCTYINYTNGDNITKLINGFYAYNIGYCVMTGSRNLTEVKRIDYHEKCHELVYNDYNHFCEVKHK